MAELISTIASKSAQGSGFGQYFRQYEPILPKVLPESGVVGSV